MSHRSERWFTRTLARKHRDCSLKANRRHPVLESLEDRVVLSVLDLTTTGSTGTINGAIFQQASSTAGGSGNISSFVRIDNTGTEQGYNTDARPYTDPVLADVDTTPTFDRSLPLSTVPIVNINGNLYREFVLDINQDINNPLLSLDEVQIFLGSAPNLQGYPGSLGTLIYDMGGSSSTWVKLNASLSSGSGGIDMVLDVPLGDFTVPNQYVYLYSHFGTQILNGTDPKNGGSANDGFEEWATGTGGNLSATTTTIYLGATGTTPLPSPVPAFSTVHDSAMVTGSKGIPTGNVSFFFYNSIDGSGTPVGAGTVALDANGVANPSDAEGPLIPGSYSFAAHYNGDTTYLPSDSLVEPFTVPAPAPPLITTTIHAADGAAVSGPVPLGTSVYDTATLAGFGSTVPTGTVTYSFTGTNGTSLAGLTAPAGWTVSTDKLTWTDQVTVNPGGTVPFPPSRGRCRRAPTSSRRSTAATAPGPGLRPPAPSSR